MKQLIQRIIIGSPFEPLVRKLISKPAIDFKTSPDYWEKRYKLKGNSGAGSYGRLAKFKAKIINDFVAENDVKTVIEYGCGDGNQLTLSKYPHYIGLDVSNTAVELCAKRFKNDPSKSFYKVGNAGPLSAQFTLSLDVIYHLIEDDVFESYMSDLFNTATRFVCIYSSNFIDDFAKSAAHVRHRKFTDWVENNANNFDLISTVPNLYQYDDKNLNNTSFADFFFFKRKEI